MNKHEFLNALQNGLSCLPPEDREERLAFYSEMIDDRMEEGLSEAEAVAAIGAIEVLISQILADTSLAGSGKAPAKPKKGYRAWEIVLLVLGAPIWLSLLIAVLAVLFSLYVVLWSALLSLWAGFVSLAVCAAAGVLACGILVLSGRGFMGVLMLAAGFVCAGVSILWYYGCKALTKALLLLTRKITAWMKTYFTRKEAAK